MKKLILLMAALLVLIISGVSIAAPDAPKLCFSATGLSITVNWTAVPNATGYRLYYAPYPYKGEDTIGSFDMGTDTSASYYLWNNANYYIATTSRDASGESPYSNIEVFQLTPTSLSESLIPCQITTLEGTWGNGVTNMALLADGTYLVDTNNDGVAEAWGSYDATESKLELTDEGGASACFDVAIQDFIVGSYNYEINREAMTLTLIDDGCTGRAASMTTQWDQDDSPSSSITNPSNGKTNSDHIDNDGDGYSESYGDCNDSSLNIGPYATEICGDGFDQDCDGEIDEGCPGESFSIDDDGDGFSENEGDCNDGISTISPNATEICGDGIDQDCDGYDDTCPIDPLSVDDDGDGFSENQGDCNDNSSSVRPNATEVCGDGIDQDCSGSDQACPNETYDSRLLNTWRWVSGGNPIDGITFRANGTYQFDFGGGCIEGGSWTGTVSNVTHTSLSATQYCDYYEYGEVETSNYSFDGNGNLLFNFENEYGDTTYRAVP